MPWSDPEHRREYHKRYYRANKDKWREKRAKWGATEKKRHATYMRGYQLRRNYGISQEEYQRMFAAQSGRCAICGTDKKKGKGLLHVDHCHATGRVRKLLCVKCNMALGWYERYGDVMSKYLADT